MIESSNKTLLTLTATPENFNPRLFKIAYSFTET
jgi:hypothetical protein